MAKQTESKKLTSDGKKRPRPKTKTDEAHNVRKRAAYREKIEAEEDRSPREYLPRTLERRREQIRASVEKLRANRTPEEAEAARVADRERKRRLAEAKRASQARFRAASKSDEHA